MTDSIEWPPQFTLKRHARAKHVKIKASAHAGLEIVTPLRFSLKHLPDILETNKDWIIKHILKFKSVAPIAQQQHSLPTYIHLHSCQEQWTIHYIKSKHKKIRYVVRPHNELVLLGNIDDHALCLKNILDWIKAYSSNILSHRIEHLSLVTRLHYNALTIRNQRTRWGSCTSAKNISLNYKLIFLPEKLMDHIIIHELCHTIHMNHSARFWRLLSTFDPNWKQHTRDIRDTQMWIPGWV